MRGRLTGAAAAAVFAAGLSAPVSASVTTTDLFGHWDAALDAYATNPYDGDAPVAAGNGDQVWAWGDQATLEGIQVAQQGELNARPIMRTNRINGLPALEFEPWHDDNLTGDKGLLVNPGTAGGATFGTTMNNHQMTLTTVFRNADPFNQIEDPFNAGGERFLISFRYAVDGSNVNDFISVYYANGNRITRVHDGAGNVQEIVTAASDIGDNWAVYSLVWDGLAGTLQEYIDGELSGELTGLATFTTTAELNQFRISDPTTSRRRRFNGEMAELLIYGSALADGDRAANEQFLLEKYAIPEPASVVLMGMGGLLLLRRRRA